MLDILAITTPIFLLLGVGYLAALGRVVDRTQIQGIGLFVIYCALPALIIKSLAQRPLEKIFDLYYLFAYGLGSATVFVGALIIALHVQRKPLNASALYALGMSASNSGFIGYPIAAMMLGSTAVVALSLCMLIENLLVIPTALALAEAGSQHGGTLGTVLQKSVMNLIKNPIILGILTGITLSLADFALPSPLFHAIDMLAAAAAPAALFVIGGTLYGLKARGMAADVSQIALGKLIVHPLAVLTAFLIMPAVDPVLFTAGVLMASAPMLSVYPIFGQRYGLEDITAATLMTTTLMSFFTISLIIWLMNISGLFVMS